MAGGTLADAILRAIDAEAVMRRLSAVLPVDENEWAKMPNVNEFLHSQAEELRHILSGWPHWLNRSSIPIATAEMVALGTSISGYPLQTTYEAAKSVLHALEVDDATIPIWRRIARLKAVISGGDSQVETARTYAPLRAVGADTGTRGDQPSLQSARASRSAQYHR